MAGVTFRSIVSARQACSKIVSWDQSAMALRPPLASCPGQRLDALYAMAPAYRQGLPPFRLSLGLVEEATVLVHPGYDGVVLDRNGRAIRETTFYGRLFWEKQVEGRIDVSGPSTRLDQAFVAFDASWWVYYHWLVFCLGAAGVANRVAPTGCPMLVPDIEACAPSRPNGVSPAVFGQVKRVVDAGRLLAVRDGSYRIGRAYILFVEDGQPSDAALHPLFDEVFQSLKGPAPQRRPSARVMVSRRGHGGAFRITGEDEAAFEPIAVEYGFRRERLERLSFQQQINLFSQAEVIVGPHGSGLANLVFAPKTAKVLELQTEMDRPGTLRPWYFVLAAAGGRPYAFLNRKAGEFSAGHLRQALAALGVERPGIGRRLVRLMRWNIRRAVLRVFHAIRWRVARLIVAGRRRLFGTLLGRAGDLPADG